MDFHGTLEPWIFGAVLSEKQKQLAANPTNATSPSTTTVVCTKKRLIQILSFGGESKPPFKRLSISDSSTKVHAKLDESARSALHRGTRRKPPSQTEGAVCELIHYTLIFDPSTADGVTVDIHKLLYKGGACMSPIGEPQRLSEQEVASHLFGAMRPPMLQAKAGPDDEPLSSQVLSQEGGLSDDEDIGSQYENIATQIPRTKDAHKRNNYPGDGGMMTGKLLDVLESFNQREATSKRPPPFDDASQSPERVSKRRYMVHSQECASSPPRDLEAEEDWSAEIKLAVGQKLALDKTVLEISTSKIDLPLPNSEVASQIANLPEMGSRSKIDGHNKAVADNFHMGAKSLSRKFISPPKVQLQYLSSIAHYADPRLPACELHVGIPPAIVLDLSNIHSVVQNSLSSAGEKSTARSGQYEDVDIDERRATNTVSEGSPQKPSLNSPERYAQGDLEKADEEELSDAESAVSWAPSAQGLPSRDEGRAQLKEGSFALGPLQSQEERLRSPATGQFAEVDEEDVVGEDGGEELESSPMRLPTPQPASLLHPIRANLCSNEPFQLEQVPSSSLSIDYELEQEVPVALPSSSGRVRTPVRSPTPVPVTSTMVPLRPPPLQTNKSPTPVPRIVDPAMIRPPMLQIERSPGGPEMSRQVEKPLFGATGTGDGGEASKPDSRAISSDPVIPATCVDSQETTSQQTASQGTSQEEALRPAICFSREDRILVPATIPAKASAASDRYQVVTSSNCDTHVVPGTAGAEVSHSPFGRVHTGMKPAGDHVLLLGRTGRKAAPSLPLQDNSNVPRSWPSSKRSKLPQLKRQDSSKSTSSITTSIVAGESREDFPVQRVNSEAPFAQEPTLTDSTPSRLEEIGRHAADRDLMADNASRLGRSILVASAATDAALAPAGDNSKVPEHVHPDIVQTMVQHPADTTAHSLDSPGATIFDRFNLAYPQFTHHRSKFVMACTYINWLQNNRKVMPVHQFLWDDFIRVFCGPYSDHVKGMQDEGGHTESPVDYYNNEVSSPIFQSNIVSQKTLPLALLSDPDLTRKHSQRLRRISTNFGLQSAETTPQEKRTREEGTTSPRPAIASNTVVEGLEFTKHDDNLLLREYDRMLELERVGRGIIAAWGMFEKQHGRHSGAEWHKRFQRHVKPAMASRLGVDVLQSTCLSQKQPEKLDSETSTREERMSRLAQRSSPILGESVPAESEEEATTTTKMPKDKLYGRSQEDQTVEKRKPDDTRRPLGAFFTPRNATNPKFTTLTRGNNTPTRIASPILDPIEREVKSSYVPRIKSKKGRGRYSLPRPGSTE